MNKSKYTEICDMITHTVLKLTKSWRSYSTVWSNPSWLFFILGSRMVYSQTTVWCELIGFHSSKSYCWSSPSQVVIFFYTLWKPLVSQSCTTWQKNRYYRTRSVPPCKSPVITVFQLYVATQWYLLAVHKVYLFYVPSSSDHWWADVVSRSPSLPRETRNFL